jgi:glycosyltransferase involved in cell wall biosynthesis
MQVRTIYVVMASFLGEYPGCATNREAKFIRAVDSFLANSYPFKKLIVVADGCTATQKLIETYYAKQDSVVCLSLEKHPIFSGAVRNRGLEYIKQSGSAEDIVCYLDIDDKLRIILGIMILLFIVSIGLSYTRIGLKLESVLFPWHRLI